MAEYIPIIVGSSVAAIVTGFIVVQNWRNIVRLLKGKTIAVLGARGVGKTHLISFLSKGSIPREYIQTLAPVKFSGKKCIISKKRGSPKMNTPNMDIKPKTRAFLPYLGATKNASPEILRRYEKI